MTCGACGSCEATLLGRLGMLRWFRCRACGLDYSTGVKPPRARRRRSSIEARYEAARRYDDSEGRTGGPEDR